MLLSDSWIWGLIDEPHMSELWGDDYKSAISKGYPKLVVENMSMIAKVIDGDVVAHTSFTDMGDWYFIGNNYVKRNFRNRGILREMVERRNKIIGDIPKIAILRPIENTDLLKLRNFIKTLGYIPVRNYKDVMDVMSEGEYFQIKSCEVWRFD